jgi:hypothetical protein
MRSELVRLRKDYRLTREQVAAEPEWSLSKLIRMEGRAWSSRSPALMATTWVWTTVQFLPSPDI